MFLTIIKRGLPYLELSVTNQKWEGFPYMVGILWFEVEIEQKRQLTTLNSILWKLFITKTTCVFQLPTNPTTVRNSRQILLTMIRIQKLCRSCKVLLFCMTRGTTAAKLKPPPMILDNTRSVLLCAQKLSNAKLCSIFQKNGFFLWHSAIQWEGEHRYLCRILYWEYFLPCSPYGNRKNNQKGKIYPDPVRNPCAFPSNGKPKSSIHEEHTSSIFRFWTRTIHDSWIQQQLCAISLGGTLQWNSIFNQCPQTSTQNTRRDLHAVIHSSQPMDSTKKEFRDSFAFFQRNYSPTGQLNETVATV